MSSEPVNRDVASNTSPQGSEELDLFELLSGRSEVPGKVTFWIGILVGLWFILGAYQADEDVKAVTSLDELLPTWHDWIWTGMAGIGILVSAAVCSYLVSSRKPGDPPYDMIAALGGAVSAAVVLVMLFEYVDSVHTLISPDGGLLWPAEKPSWFIPMAALGATLPLVALILARRGQILDTALGLFLSVAPLVVFSLPTIFGMGQTDLVRWMPTIYFVGGLSYMVSGLRPFERAPTISLESMEFLVPRLLAGMLVFTGILGLLMVSADEDISRSMDAIWVLPLFINVAVSVALLVAVNNAPEAEVAWSRDRDAPGRHRSLAAGLCMCFTGAFVSAVVLSLMTLSYLDVTNYPSDHRLYALSLPRNMWLYPLSMVGTTLAMASVNLLSPGTRIDRSAGLLFASVPTVLASMLALLSAGSSTLYVAPQLVAGVWALLVCVGFAAAVILSGMRIETFVKLQLPVLREKSALNRKRYRQIMRQVLRNPMGVIGVIILSVFIVLAIIGPFIAPYEVDMTTNGPFEKLMPESSEHWMGTDTFKHDIFSQLLYGAKTSITVGVVAAAISSVLGAAIGLYSGYAGGWKDEVIMRLNDIALSIPWLVLMIIIAAFMGSIDLLGIILVIGLTGWSGTARLVRAQVLSLKERQYIERARAIGSDDMHIINRHILPNAFPLVFANTILTVAGSILAEATLSFLGLEPHGVVTWGTMLSYAQEAGAFTIGLHWWIIAPGLCIVLVVLGFTLLGYALDDVMNPKLRKR